MAKIKVVKNEKGGKDLTVNGVLIDDVMTATVYIAGDKVTTINIEIMADVVDIQDQKGGDPFYLVQDVR